MTNQQSLIILATLEDTPTGRLAEKKEPLQCGFENPAEKHKQKRPESPPSIRRIDKTTKL